MLASNLNVRVDYMIVSITLVCLINAKFAPFGNDHTITWGLIQCKKSSLLGTKRKYCDYPAYKISVELFHLFMKDPSYLHVHFLRM